MHHTPASTWYEANSNYLLLAIENIRQTLKSHVAHRQNLPNEPTPNLQPALDATAAEMSAPPALVRLCTTFHLSPFERDILLLCVAQAILPNFPELCANAQGKPHLDYPTLGLALHLFPHAYWSATTPDAPLQRWQLLHLETHREPTLSRIQIDSCILHYLMGEPYQDSRHLGLILPMLMEAYQQFPLQPSHQQIATQLTRLLYTTDAAHPLDPPQPPFLRGENFLKVPFFKGDLGGSSQPPKVPLFKGDLGGSSQPLPEKYTDGKHALPTLRSSSSPTPTLQLCGLEIADKWAIAATACTTLKRPLKVLSAHRLPTDANELHQLIRRWQREVALTQSVLLLDCDAINSTDTALLNTLAQLIQELHSPLILSTAERLSFPQQTLITFDVPKLSYNEQRALWQANLATFAPELNGFVDILVSQFNLSTPTIQAACWEVFGVGIAKNLNGKHQSSPPFPPGSGEPDCTEHSPIPNRQSQIQNHLWDSCRKIARPRLDDLAQRIDSTATWDDLVLPDAQRQVLRDIVAHTRQRAKVYSDWGFASKSGRGLGISALFAGASGTGKTMAAEVLTQELRLDLYRIDLSTVVSKYIGETEKNLRRIFDAAEAGGAVLLFDEADALFGKRTQVKDSHDRHANVEVSYLLQRMEAYQGLAILTTNLKDSLDQAFLRRLRFIVKFSFPDASQRAEIWQRIFPKQTPTEDLEPKKLAQLNVAGGNIRNIALNAAFNAADAGEPVMMKHILAAAKSEYIKLERTLTDAETRGWIRTLRNE